MRAMLQLFGLLLAVGALTLVAAPLDPATAHRGGRYGTVGDMERTLKADPNYLMAFCNGFGTARKRGNPKLFWAFKHFRCWVVINLPYRQLCLTIHTRRNGSIVITRAVQAGDALPGDCG